MDALNDLIHCINANHFTAQYVADHSGLDRKTVAAIMSGETDNPRIQTLEAIAQVCDGSIKFETKLSQYSVLSGDVSYYIKVIADKQQIIDQTQQHQAEVVEMYKQTIKKKDAWIWRLFITCVVLIAISVYMAAIAPVGI